MFGLCAVFELLEGMFGLCGVGLQTHANSDVCRWLQTIFTLVFASKRMLILMFTDGCKPYLHWFLQANAC